ncbi:MAG: DedA family protein [Candidatus Sericytochromatia bacterium]|nr:DedA family protein [Candidatus Sericytochromatia bacterium]
MHPELLPWINQYGYLAVALAIGIESAGIPFPGETTLVVAAMLAARGHLQLGWVIASAALGAILGDNLGYWFGKHFGRRIVAKVGRYVGLTPERMIIAERFFHHHGDKTVFLGRWFALLRAYAAFLAGIHNMPFGRFFLYNALGGIGWALCFGFIGYTFGVYAEVIIRRMGWFSLLILAAGLLFVAWRHWWRPRRARNPPGQ